MKAFQPKDLEERQIKKPQNNDMSISSSTKIQENHESQKIIDVLTKQNAVEMLKDDIDSGDISEANMREESKEPVDASNNQRKRKFNDLEMVEILLIWMILRKTIELLFHFPEFLSRPINLY